MATAIIMPRQGQSVESCLIGKWYKEKGDTVSVGDVLFSYETDKAAFEEESKVDGIMLDIFFEEGDEVECLVNVCVIGSEGESVEGFRPIGSPASAVGSAAAATPAVGGVSSADVCASAAVASAVCTSVSGFVRISPRAKRLAERTKADISFAVPTGAGGRIIERDVIAVLSQGHRVTTAARAAHNASDSGIASVSSKQTVNTPDSEVSPLSNVRKFIAKAMHTSLASTAQLTNHSSFDATDILNLRKNLKAYYSDDPRAKVTITDIIIYAASRVILKHKSINAHFLGDSMTVFNNAHLGVAVDTPRGLLVPTIFNANAMSLAELSLHTKGLFDRCKQGSIEPDFLKGASFTISNLGGMGVEMFTPVLNPPQTGLLGVCSIIERTRDGKSYPAMGLSLTYDHQAVDGADAAKFTVDLIAYLEKFSFNLALDAM